MSHNPHLDQFMQAFPHEGLTFDDVSLGAEYADFLPADTSLATRLQVIAPPPADLIVSILLDGEEIVDRQNISPAASAEVQPAGRKALEVRSKIAPEPACQLPSGVGQLFQVSNRRQSPLRSARMWRSPSLSGPPSMGASVGMG